MKDTDSAFPVFDTTRVNGDGTLCTDYGCSSSGMTLKQYAAIHLKIPRSGDPEIDGMIRESRRTEFAEKMMKIVMDELMSWPESAVHDDWQNYVAYKSFRLADAMLAKWEKEKDV
jgi:hypothetical protein